MTLSKRGIGIFLLGFGIGAYIIRESLHYIAAFSLTFKTTGISNTMMENNLSLIPPPFPILIPLALVVLGIFYLVWSEFEGK